MSDFVIGLVIGIAIPYIIAYADIKYTEWRERREQEKYLDNILLN